MVAVTVDLDSVQSTAAALCDLCGGTLCTNLFWFDLIKFLNDACPDLVLFPDPRLTSANSHSEHFENTKWLKKKIN
jgi:hypothetical protein